MKGKGHEMKSKVLTFRSSVFEKNIVYDESFFAILDLIILVIIILLEICNTIKK